MSNVFPRSGSLAEDGEAVAIDDTTSEKAGALRPIAIFTAWSFDEVPVIVIVWLNILVCTIG